MAANSSIKGMPASYETTRKIPVRRISKDSASYQIRMSAGFSYHVWLTSRAFESEFDYLPWIKQLKINDKLQRKLGRKRILSDFAYFIGCYYILLHEVSHVILGHCDYLQEEMGFDSSRS